MQTHDGPGLRTTVFMKGCSLRCAWCHNPESISARQEIWLDETKCIGCGFCHNERNEQLTRANWDGNEEIIQNCPAKALELLRTSWSAEELLQKINRDAGFFDEGGVTFSGGEPALQWPFLSKVMEQCKATGLHTALDTCGAAAPKAFDALLPHCDLILFDLKIIHPEEHQKWTGQKNAQILDNFKKISAYASQNPELKIWIRTPLIPGATDSEENIRAIGRFLQDSWTDQIERWELCTFNNLCVEKYRKLNMDWRFADTPLMDREHAQNLHRIAAESLGAEKSARVFLKGRMHDSSKQRATAPTKTVPSSCQPLNQ